MYVCIYLPIYQSIDLSIYLPIDRSIYLSINLSINLSIYLFIDMCFFLKYRFFGCLSISLFSYLSTALSYLSIDLSTDIAIYLCMCLSICLITTPLAAQTPPRQAKKFKYNNLIPTYTSKSITYIETREGVNKCSIPLRHTRMEFEHFSDTPLDNLSSRLNIGGAGGG